MLGFTKTSRTFLSPSSPYGDVTDTRMEHRNGKTSETKRPAWFRNLFSFRFFTEEDRKISDKAIIDPAAEIAEDVEIGPFCVIGPNVKIDAGCILHNNVTVSGNTTIGRDNIFFPNSVIGTAPQDKKFKGAATRLIIGTGNAFREACTVHVGTEKGGGLTRIDDDNLFMVNSHIGHDALIGSHCVVANNVMIAGHVVVGDYVVMNGGVGVNQFVSIGDFAYLSGYARVHHDVPPFCKIDGSDEIRALNKVGMARSGMSAVDIAAVDEVFRKLFLKKRPLLTAMREFEGVEGLNPNVVQLLQFLTRRNQGKHGRYLETQRNKLAEPLPPTVAPDVHPAEVVVNPVDPVAPAAEVVAEAIPSPSPVSETAPAQPV
ncbi:acyl-ACP--UDP-N-acetylglucosamine O-acyltransferase [Humisphaera borealis]|uniref:acyl-ACP--UDP-N-acetylglucosamine O-acyltransferase n=1 Tax=Humisphaera borealis TaxID=2807512 RepID=UPI001F15260A|nr:acyl-ACP--UDP-N-acetylglucosamine O-acyltransferase [Humisphaera borealis]